MKIILNTIIACAAGLCLLICGCRSDENKPRKNIDQLVTIVLTDGNYYIIPLEKSGSGYIALLEGGRTKKVGNSPEKIAKDLYGDKVKTARWTNEK